MSAVFMVSYILVSYVMLRLKNTVRINVFNIAIMFMASCNQNEKSETINNTNTEIMEKQEKQKIEELLNTYQKSLNTSELIV